MESTVAIKKIITRNTTVGDLLANPEIAPLAQQFLAQYNQDDSLTSISEGEDGNEIMEAMMKYLPLRALVAFNPTKITDDMLNEMLETFNTTLVK